MSDASFVGVDLVRRMLVAGAPALEVDAAISRLQRPSDVAAVASLLALLGDSYEFEEIMYSIVHAAEGAPPEIFIKGFVEYSPELTQRSPEWASILLMRIANSDLARRLIVSEIRSAPKAARAAVLWLCEGINSRGFEFIARTLPVMMAARE